MSSSPRRNLYTRASYNGISAGVIPHEDRVAGSGPGSAGLSGSPGGVPSHHSIEGKLGHGHGHIAPGAVGLAGVAQRSVGAVPGGAPGSPGHRAPEVNAEAEEYYGGKEVWSRSRTYSNVSLADVVIAGLLLGGRRLLMVLVGPMCGALVGWRHGTRKTSTPTNGRRNPLPQPSTITR